VRSAFDVRFGLLLLGRRLVVAADRMVRTAKLRPLLTARGLNSAIASNQVHRYGHENNDRNRDERLGLVSRVTSTQVGLGPGGVLATLAGAAC
jgi:hypothetical protein